MLTLVLWQHVVRLCVSCILLKIRKSFYYFYVVRPGIRKIITNTTRHQEQLSFSRSIYKKH